MVNEKEDMLKVYRHEIPDGLPHLLSEGVCFLAPQNGFWKDLPGDRAVKTGSELPGLIRKGRWRRCRTVPCRHLQ